MFVSLMVACVLHIQFVAQLYNADWVTHGLDWPSSEILHIVTYVHNDG